MTGTFSYVANYQNTFDGVFALGEAIPGNGQGGQTNYQVTFDASRVARTATETRPTNITVNYFIRIN